MLVLLVEYIFSTTFYYEPHSQLKLLLVPNGGDILLDWIKSKMVLLFLMVGAIPHEV